MSKDPFHVKKEKFEDLPKSKGILDNFAVRKVVSTQEGTIEKTPVNPHDIVNKEYVDNSSFKTGMIQLWYGTIATIPTGWVLCNGSNGTPDLRNKFVVCADADVGGIAKSTLTGSATQTGGSANHTHTISSGTTGISVSDTGHSHGTSTSAGTNGAGTNFVYSIYTGYASLSVNDMGHTHGGATGTNNPPYFALAYIMKL